ncbi:hypothetical protein BpHYR1_013593 [Brachionus plicatilis]|uniref:Uncharacterized protein n=1 Tax=Brachionus plicatilis TaxID=10195 RepID=A0A3M7R126_BRAPC|nr:hypothetical protein BpHYR1_013593 [Brachionus plicatilis]
MFFEMKILAKKDKKLSTKFLEAFLKEEYQRFILDNKCDTLVAGWNYVVGKIDKKKILELRISKRKRYLISPNKDKWIN